MTSFPVGRFPPLALLPVIWIAALRPIGAVFSTSGIETEESGDIPTSEVVSDSSSFSSFCETETFHASCSVDEVIVVTHAQYGRMRISRCVKLDYGHLGCVSSVMELADSRCSGRRRCEIRIPDSDFAKYKPCPDDLKPYLEIAYTCVKVQTSKEFCVYPGSTPVSSPHSGFLSSLVTEMTGCGGLINPWSITAAPGQTIRLTLHDFGLPRGRRLTTQRHPQGPCFTYAVIREPPQLTNGNNNNGLLSTRNVTICGGVMRQSIVYVTSGNRLDVGIAKHDHLTYGPYYIFEYRAIGCPDLSPIPNSWFIRSGDSVTIKCNFTREVYQWKCKDNRWTGDHWNCSVGRLGSSVEKLSNSGLSISYGTSLLMILIIALAIGIFVLISGMVFLKRRNERARAVMLQRHHAADDSASDKQYYGTSLVRNLAGSAVLRSEKLPWNKDDVYNPGLTRSYASCRTGEKSHQQDSPLLAASPPPYPHSRRCLPCGCDAYVSIGGGGACADQSSSGLEEDLGGGGHFDGTTIYYVLDPQRHAAHRSRLRSEDPTSGTPLPSSREPEVDGNAAAAAASRKSWSLVALAEDDDDDGSHVVFDAKSPPSSSSCQDPAAAAAAAAAQSKFPEVVSDCEHSIQNDEVQLGNTL